MICTFTISFLYQKAELYDLWNSFLCSQKCSKLSKFSFMYKRYDMGLTQCCLKAETICFAVICYSN